MSNDNISDQSSRTRRGVLKGIGAASIGVAGLATTGSVSAATDTDAQKYDRSLELRAENNWTVEQWHTHLAEENIDFNSASDTYVAEQDSSSGPTVSPDNLARDELKTITTYSDLGSYSSIEVDWRHNTGDLEEFGEGPPDFVGLSFSGSDYERTFDRNEWVYYDPENVADPQFADTKDPDGGASARYKDGVDTDASGYFGVYVEPQHGGQKVIELDYVHTFNFVTVDSVSIGPAGLVVGLSNNTKRWDYERSYTQEEIANSETDYGRPLP